MRWLVDGYNVIRGDPDLRDAERKGLGQGRAALLRLVAVAVERSGDPFTVVFDGEPRGQGSTPATSRITVRFSLAPQKADDLLVAEARRLGSGAIVVSSDRTVQDAARRAGATAVPAGAFIRRLEEPSGPDDDPDDADDEDAGPASKGGPSHRLSRDDRAARRALERLRSR